MILTITFNPAQDRIYPIDNFQVGKIFRSEEVAVNAAGKGVNSSRVLRDLGYSTAASGFLGGSAGEYISSELQKGGIADEFVRIEGQTRVCLKVADNVRNETTEILEPGPQVRAEEIEEFFAVFAKLISGAEIVIASGSLPLGMPRDSYRCLVLEAQKKDTRVILDTSGDPFRAGIKAAPYMIKPNKEEVEFFLKRSSCGREDFIEALQKFRNQGIELPVITLGAEGCLTVKGNTLYQFVPPELEVKNVVGSGDAFVAGCAAALAEKRDFRAVLKMGTACGAANTQYYKTGKVTPELVNEYYQLVTVNEYEI